MKGKIPTFVFAKIGTIRLFYHRCWLAKTNRLIISSINFYFMKFLYLPMLAEVEFSMAGVTRTGSPLS